MSAISNVGYLVVGGRDLAAWSNFGTEVVGMQVARRSPLKPM